jgi:aminopeptidase
MTDPRLSNLANTLVNYSVGVAPKEWVLIHTCAAALPLAKEVLKFVLQAGGNPTIFLDTREDDLGSVFMSEANDAQIDWISPVETMLFEEVDVLISLKGSENTRTMSGINPNKQRRRAAARRGLIDTYLKRSAEGKLRWTMTQYPCFAYAQDADMSLSEYEDFVYAATFSDQPDPIQIWKNIRQEQEHLVKWLEGKKQVVVRGPNSELQLSIEGRPFINCSGDKNMPDGEIFTGPVENSANGWVKFTYPAIHRGVEVEGVELEFKDGKVVSARAQKNERYLLSLLDIDPGARYLGEFAIGTNYGIKRFTKSILYDEKIGGSFHMAVGAGYPETGSLNRSALHWDFICDMRDNSEILVDGELFYKNGEFKI